MPYKTWHDPKAASAVDKAVVAHIKARRIALGLSQMQVADKIGVAYQQIHKYENGLNRLSVGRLAQMVRALEMRGEDFLPYLNR